VDFYLNYLQRPELFITAAALQTAILIFLANLWMKVGKISDGKNNKNKKNLALGITRSYIAIGYSVTAFALVIIFSNIERYTIGLFTASFFMGEFVVLILVASALTQLSGVRGVGESLFLH